MMSATNLIKVLPKFLFMSTVNEWMSDCDLVCLDTAYCNKDLRPIFLSYLINCKAEGNEDTNYREFLDWVALREMTCKRFRFSSTDYFQLASLTQILSRTVHLCCLEAPCCLELASILNQCNSIESLKLIGRSSSTIAMLNDLIADICNLTALDLSKFTELRNKPLCDLNIPTLKSLICDPTVFTIAFLKELAACEYYHGPLVEETQQWLLSLTAIEFFEIKHFRTYFMSDNDLIAVAHKCPRLTHFHTVAKIESDKCIQILASHCTALQSLSLARLAELGDDAAAAIGKYCLVLAEINLSGSKITDKGVECIVKGCRRLNVLEFSDCLNLTDISVAIIAQHCRDLSILNLSNCPLDDVSALPKLHEANPDMSVDFLSVDMLQVLLLLVLPQCISFKSSADDDAYNLSVNAIVGGREVHYHERTYLPKDWFMSVCCPDLLNFSIRGNALIDDECIEHLTQACPMLSRISIVDCYSITSHCLKAITTNCPNLTHLDMRHVDKVTDAIVTALVVAHPRLDKLWLADCQEITNAALYSIAAHCPNIRSVSFAGIKTITTRGVCHLLRRCTKIISINMTSCEQIDSRVLKCLGHRIKRMRRVDVSNCYLINREDRLEYFNLLGPGCEEVLQWINTGYD